MSYRGEKGVGRNEGRRMMKVGRMGIFHGTEKLLIKTFQQKTPGHKRGKLVVIDTCLTAFKRTCAHQGRSSATYSRRWLIVARG
jgi:hypothetical protein